MDLLRTRFSARPFPRFFQPTLAALLSATFGFVSITTGAPTPPREGVAIGALVQQLPGVDGGQLLLGELNCVACHQASSAVQSHLFSRISPALGAGGLRVTPQFLRVFLNDPRTEKPGTTMPDMLHALAPAAKADVVDALVHYLVSLNPPASEDTPVGATTFQVEQGRILFHTVGCVACHEPQSSPASLQPGAGSENEGAAVSPSLASLQQRSLPLGDLARKTTVGELSRFLMDPLQARPSGRMPSLKLSSSEATALAIYLLRDQASAEGRPPAKIKGLDYQYYEGNLGKVADLDTVKVAASGRIDNFNITPRHREENAGFRFTGFIKVPAEGDYTFYTSSDDGSKLYIGTQLVVDNDGTHAPTERRGRIRLSAGEHPIMVTWFNAGGGAELQVSWSGPGLGKERIPAEVLSHQGLPMLPLGQAPFSVDPAKADQGREYFASFGCAACHEVNGHKTPVTRSAPPLAQLKPKDDAGCLGSHPGEHAAAYHLSGRQQQLLQQTLADRHRLEQPLSPEDKVNQTMAALNCFACHSRGGKGGPDAERAPYFRTVGDADLGDEGRIPPHLNRVGAKLQPDWMREVLLNKAAVRPYMATRMPQFGPANVGSLPEAFAKADNPFPSATRAAYPAEDAKYGWKLVGTSGLSCISCHMFAGHPSLGIPAMDLTYMSRRLKKEWFHAYLLDPPSLRPGTRMPAFWPEGKAVNQDVLEGNTDRQINAIWAYLSKGKDAGLPPGLIQGKMELVASNEAVIYRNFIAGAGPRAIGVGYPEKANLAFDAENLRLALIWQGPFIDAARHRTGRGEGFEPPLGYHVISMPEGAPFAILPDPNAPWPKEEGAAAGYQMHGYKLGEKREPMFLYAFRNIRIQDDPAAEPGELDGYFDRHFTLQSDAPPDHLWFRAWSGASLQPRPDGSYLADGKLTLKFKGAGEPVVRQSEGKSELLVPVNFHGNHAAFQEELIW